LIKFNNWRSYSPYDIRYSSIYLYFRRSPYAKDLEDVTSTENERVLLRYERAIDSEEDDDEEEDDEDEEDEEDEDEDDDLELSDDWDTE